MTGSVVFPGGAYRSLRDRLMEDDRETCTVFLANSVPLESGAKFIIKTEIPVEERDYAERSTIAASLRSETVFQIAQAAKRESQAVVFVHTHPKTESFPEFSRTDRDGEASLARFLKGYMPSQDSVSLIVAASGCSAHIMPSGAPLRVVEIGPEFSFLSRLDVDEGEILRQDRQVRALGRGASAVFQNLKIGIVGLGGTGSLTAQQLAYLGIQDLILVDDDIIEPTNLNRVVGATSSDIGRSKTAVASDLIKRISPHARVRCIEESILDDASVMKLRDRDFLFCCTDSHGSRAVINQFAYQFVIPCIDMAISIVTHEGRILHIVGRVQLLAPGLGCLTCGNLLDPGEVRIDLMQEHERRKDPYFLGQAEPQPAVISLNSTVSSLAVTMFIGTVTHVPLSARFQRYDALAGVVRAVEHLPRTGCIVCSEAGALARAQGWPLPTRKLP